MPGLVGLLLASSSGLAMTANDNLAGLAITLGYPAWVAQTRPGYPWSWLTLVLAELGWSDPVLTLVGIDYDIDIGNDWRRHGSGCPTLTLVLFTSHVCPVGFEKPH